MAVSQEEVGRRVAAWRTRRGLSQAELAALVEGLDQSKVSRVESGGRRLSSVELADIAAALRIDPLDLIEDVPVGSALVAARGDLTNAAVPAAVRRGVDVLRTWRALDDDDLGPSVGTRPDLGALPRSAIHAGNLAAERLRSSLGLKDDAIDSIVDLAASIGIVTAYEPFDGQVDGVCLGDLSRCVAVVNTASWGSRQRFTLAHEIGHWVLGDVSDGAVEDEDIFGADASQAEKRANAFAAQLLVPDGAVRRLEGAREREAIRFAYDYGVSLSTLSWRIHNAIHDADLAVAIRYMRPFEAAAHAGCVSGYENDRDARNRIGVTSAFEAAARRAADVGAISERHLSAVVPFAAELPGGPA